MYHFIKNFAQINFLLLIFAVGGCAQTVPANKPTTLNPEFDKKISSLLRFNVPLISVQELEQKQDQVILLDARELEEYQTSHIKGAHYIGYNKFDKKDLAKFPKDKEIVLYCSIGYRSEKIGNRLQKLGFTKVSNLYGSIFEWVNQGNPVVDKNEQPTNLVHGYNKNWSQWINQDSIKKVW